MSSQVFHFKHFTIHQDRCAMKVGTDGVLLGSWVQPVQCQTILDIGTGTGLIALMLAQKTTAHITGIDIDKNACIQAQENVNGSPWAHRIKIEHRALQDFVKLTNQKFDLIISNPPYFVDAYQANDAARNLARQANASLSFDELIQGVKKLLHPHGSFYVILPFKEGIMFKNKAMGEGMFYNRLVRVKTKMDKIEKRVIMCFGFANIKTTEEEIIIHEEDRCFTEDYKNLTRDYYPAF